jgi:tRNA threonylcarbamoyladenosine biosynthesis protein TsaE
MAWTDHPPILETRSLHWADEGDCERCAQQMAGAAAFWPSSSIALDGPLGAGKTTFVRHLLRALGVAGRIKSPSYAVMEPYITALGAVSHFDFYRFDHPREWDDAGFRDVFAAPGLKLMEWPEKAAPALPTPDLLIALEPSDLAAQAREVQAHALTEQGRRLLYAMSLNPVS